MFMHTLKKMSLRTGAQMAKQQASKPLVGNIARRTFSSGIQNGMTGGQMFGAGLGMAAITGLTYLSYMGHQARMNATPEQQLTMFHPVVQSRVQSTMSYFTGSIMATGGLMAARRRSAFCLGNRVGGCRIPVGREPETVLARLHHTAPTGVPGTMVCEFSARTLSRGPRI